MFDLLVSLPHKLYDYKKIRSILTSFDYQASSFPIATLVIKKYYIRGDKIANSFRDLEEELCQIINLDDEETFVCLSYNRELPRKYLAFINRDDTFSNHRETLDMLARNEFLSTIEA